jgi:sugar (pentulose or hexulose) kinase
METKKKIAFATLDIGTSQIKLGVYCPFLSKEIILINNLQNELVYGSSGEVRAEYEVIREKSFQLFNELGSFLKSNNVKVLYIGICGHVSSLLEWNKIKGKPPAKPFPIWLDTTSYNSLAEYDAVMGNGKSKQIIGTFLPSGTNWLFTKLLNRKQTGFSDESIFLQVGDAIFYELSGQYKTHFSSQISMVNLKKREYAQELLDHLQLDKCCLPAIEYDPSPVVAPLKNSFGFPDESFVFPAMADLYTSLYGLRLRDKEGFMLANTSEQAGAFYLNPPKQLDNFLSISFNPGFINYGSTNTGGNVLSWFLTNVLNKTITAKILHELTAKAGAIEPGATPIILPYLQGERAPLWNSKLTASILELRSIHTEVHLFRAILESISFARRQCFEEIGITDLHVIKIAGGSSKNPLWNTIRASVLNKPIAVADEKELSMAGSVYYIMEAIESPFEKPAINFSIIEPNYAWVNSYDDIYARFIKYQKLLS